MLGRFHPFDPHLAGVRMPLGPEGHDRLGGRPASTSGWHWALVSS
ncbi:hypothetical protein [Amycolatopsis sp. CA-126428]|nr:hypothetical protein [Amycolatopsis sp. CA-126428]